MHVVGMPEIGHQSGLGPLVFQVAPQVSAAQTAAQALLGVGKEAIDSVIGTLHEGLCSARAIAHDRVPAQLPALAFEVAQHDGFRLVGKQPLRGLLAQLLVVTQQVGGDRLQALGGRLH